jgi:Trypsin
VFSCLHTTAYCATSEQDHGVPIKVAANFTGYVDQSYAHKRNVIEVVIHQASETSDVYYAFSDIALLFLDAPITTEVTPIQLNIEAGVPTDGQVLKAIGIGVTNAERNNYPDNLMEVDLPKVDDNSCKEIWFDIEEYAVDATTMVCAGYPEGGKSICAEDLGNEHCFMQHDCHYTFLLMRPTMRGSACYDFCSPGMSSTSCFLS